MRLVADIKFELPLGVQNLYACRLCCRRIDLFSKSLVSILHTGLSLLDHMQIIFTCPTLYHSEPEIVCSFLLDISDAITNP